MIARTRWVAIAAAVLALVVVAIVARSRPSHPFTSLKPAPASVGHVITPPPISHHGAAVGAPSERSHHGQSSGYPHWLGSLLLALLAAGAVLALGRFTRGRWGFSFGDRRRRPAHGADVAAGASLPPPTLTDAVELGISDLEHGPVTDAIIACWVRVEAAAGHAGLAVRPSETSTEFVDRVLGSFGAREQSLRRMSALYREARFSEHVMDESSRDDARRCLREISDDLGGTRDSV